MARRYTLWFSAVDVNSESGSTVLLLLLLLLLVQHRIRGRRRWVTWVSRDLVALRNRYGLPHSRGLAKP
eukprot:3666528-Rhodomonas_salina.1